MFLSAPQKFMALLVFLATTLAVSGCGGGDDGGSQTPNDTKAGAPANLVISRLQIQQTGLLLGAIGESRHLQAIAYDQTGRPMDTPLQWTSNNPSVISVNDAGEVVANSSNGSAQITAEAGGITSPPLIAVVIQTRPNTILLRDAQILGDPQMVAPEAPYTASYAVDIASEVNLSVGAVLINSESKPVGGRILKIDRQTDGSATVTLAVISATELLPGLALDEQIELPIENLDLSPDLLAAYDVDKDGRNITFVARPPTDGQKSLQRVLRGVSPGTVTLGPFLCAIESPSNPSIALNMPPLLAISSERRLEVSLSDSRKRIVLHNNDHISVQASVGVQTDIPFDISCRAHIGDVRIPIGGVLSLIIGGNVPYGLGFKAGSKVNVVSGTVFGATISANLQTQIGIDCAEGSDCEFIRHAEGVSTAEPIFPGTSISEGATLEPELGGFLYAAFEIGPPKRAPALLRAGELTVGGTLRGSIANMSKQIADDSYQSSYELSLDSEISAGTDVTDFARRLGFDRVTAVSLSASEKIAVSPFGTVSVEPGAIPGKPNVVHVGIASNSEEFGTMTDGYNIKELLLVESRAGATSILAREPAAPGQKEFDLRPATDDRDPSAKRYVFVVTRLLPSDFFALELGEVRATGDGIWGAGDPSTYYCRRVPTGTDPGACAQYGYEIAFPCNADPSSTADVIAVRFLDDAVDLMTDRANLHSDVNRGLFARLSLQNRDTQTYEGCWNSNFDTPPRFVPNCAVQSYAMSFDQDFRKATWSTTAILGPDCNGESGSELIWLSPTLPQWVGAPLP